MGRSRYWVCPAEARRIMAREKTNFPGLPATAQDYVCKDPSSIPGRFGSVGASFCLAPATRPTVCSKFYNPLLLTLPVLFPMSWLTRQPLDIWIFLFFLTSFFHRPFSFFLFFFFFPPALSFFCIDGQLMFSFLAVMRPIRMCLTTTLSPGILRLALTVASSRTP